MRHIQNAAAFLVGAMSIAGAIAGFLWLDLNTQQSAAVLGAAAVAVYMAASRTRSR